MVNQINTNIIWITLYKRSLFPLETDTYSIIYRQKLLPYTSMVSYNILNLLDFQMLCLILIRTVIKLFFNQIVFLGK